jgi:hypothetical protein
LKRPRLSSHEELLLMMLRKRRATVRSPLNRRRHPIPQVLACSQARKMKMSDQANALVFFVCVEKAGLLSRKKINGQSKAIYGNHCL